MGKSEAKMKVVMVKASSLKPAAYNPRQWSDDEMERLKASIVKFGMVEQIVVNAKTMTIVGGHMRHEAARHLEITELPCVFVSLTPKQERDMNLRLNRGGEWDMMRLAAMSMSRKDLEDIGFQPEDLSAMFGDSAEVEDASGGEGGGTGTKFTIPLEFEDEAEEEEARENFVGDDAFERTRNLRDHYAKR